MVLLQGRLTFLLTQQELEESCSRTKSQHGWIVALPLLAVASSLLQPWLSHSLLTPNQSEISLTCLLRNGKCFDEG